MVQSIGTTVGWIYQASGRTDWLFRWGIGATIVIVASICIGLTWGLRGVAIAYTVCNLLLMYPSFTIPGRLIGLRFREVIGAVQAVLAASVFMGACVWLVLGSLPGGLAAGFELAIGTAVGIAVYAATIHVVSPAPYEEFRKLVAGYRRGVSPAPL